MKRIKAIILKYREPLAYLFFGGVTTAVNIAVYAGLHTWLGVQSDLSNAIAWVLSVLVAYVTNRRWVFMSRARGRAMLREAGAFVTGRAATGLMDMGLMHLATEVLGPGMVSASARPVWDMGSKLIINVLVVVLNYVFSKLLIFRKDER